MKLGNWSAIKFQCFFVGVSSIMTWLLIKVTLLLMKITRLLLNVSCRVTFDNNQVTFNNKWVIFNYNRVTFINNWVTYIDNQVILKLTPTKNSSTKKHRNLLALQFPSLSSLRPMEPNHKIKLFQKNCSCGCS